MGQDAALGMKYCILLLQLGVILRLFLSAHPRTNYITTTRTKARRREDSVAEYLTWSSALAFLNPREIGAQGMCWRDRSPQ